MYSISAIQSRVLFLIYIVNNVIISISLRLLVLDRKKKIAKNSRKLHNAVSMKVTQYNHEFLRRHHLSFK